MRAFVEGYLAGLRAFAQDDREKWHEYRIDNSPDLIKNLLQGAVSSRKDFLDEKVDEETGRFKSTEEIVPHSAHKEAFSDALADYAKDVTVDGNREGFFTICDVAIKKGSGTASLGLDRFWVLVEGPQADDRTQNVLLELKQARPSALRGLVPPSAQDKLEGDDEAEQVARAQRIHLVGGDPFYGTVTLDDRPFIVRERSPLKDDIDLEDLDEDTFMVYADVCGRALAQPHARSDEDTGILEGNAEQQILSSIHPPVFTDDLVRFAETSRAPCQAGLESLPRRPRTGRVRDLPPRRVSAEVCFALPRRSCTTCCTGARGNLNFLTKQKPPPQMRRGLGVV